MRCTIPSPQKNESRDSYINRFMASAEARASFPNSDQRYAVALVLWKKHSEGKSVTLAEEIKSMKEEELQKLKEKYK